jgi:pimeloyl-ACP methyl ester carboxylesterase
MNANALIPHTSVRRVNADGVTIFYREAGPANAPVVLLLHGFPTSSFQYRDLIPRLADRCRVIAPDLPGFGFTEVPDQRRYKYSFDALASTMLTFTDVLQLKSYALYVFDYGAPVGFRLATARAGPSYCDRFAKRERVRRGPWRCLGPNPKILGRTDKRKPGSHSTKYSDT